MISTKHKIIYQKYFNEIQKLKKNWISISKISKKFNLPMIWLRNQLIKDGLHQPGLTQMVERYNEHRTEIIMLKKQGVSIRELNNRFNISKETLTKKLIKEKLHSISKTKEERYGTPSTKNYIKYHKQIINDYNSGLSLHDLSRKYSVSFTHLCRQLINEKVHKTINRDYQVNHSFFERIDSPAKAYWLGWMYSDGIVQKHSVTKGKYITLELNVRDLEVIEQFKHDLDSTYPIRYIKGNNSYRLSFMSPKIFDDLGKLGVIPKKSLVLEFPITIQVPKEFIKPFLQGYFEGDGSLILSKRKDSNRLRLAIDIVGTINFLNGYKEELIRFLDFDNLNIRIVKEKRSKRDVHNLRVSDTYGVLKICDTILFSHPSKMERKRNKFLKMLKWIRDNPIDEQTFINRKSGRYTYNENILNLIDKYSNKLLYV